jgi:hypothetical protein
MQRDNLEKFISSNREAFDKAIPNLKVWAEIDKALSRKGARRRTLWQNLRIAAAVLLLLFTGGIVGNYLAGTSFGDASVSLRDIDPEYAEMAQYYEKQIDDKVKQLASYEQGQVVLEDFEQLDKTMEELKEDLLRAPKGKEEQIIENLIRSYQTKVQILERVLERIQSTDPQILKPEDNEVSI